MSTGGVFAALREQRRSSDERACWRTVTVSERTIHATCRMGVSTS
ncbi:MAG: hypothetical protein PHE53_11760 [Thermoguttaceae bacterium]|nr:hypothetical protein [Thermoguttaceae bacterium]